MNSIKDIKILLFLGYAVGYPLAVLPPIFMDPLLKSHVLFASRSYVHARWCIAIYLLLICGQSILLTRSQRIRSLYFSVCGFMISIVVSLPLFLPEFPHGNLFAVGITTTFLSAFSIFVWSIGLQISIDPESLKSSGEATFDYIKALFSFVRQGAFAGVALFGALFFAAFSTEFKYVENTVTDKRDIFLLNLNIALQVAFYTLYSVGGVVRFFFNMNLHILSQFKDVAARMDREKRANILPPIAPSKALPSDHPQEISSVSQSV
jgi:hypothetical protein